ncbi:hypothetical protein BOTBODRAFT_100738 [Botryobasidium botryosum FD-172 SS1]|uniref:DinB-like domain-containing protein n=1 Tax=Botryobasidium botryosum (strain FD-172 SS1) TaxID=930990 RepID=A0A067MY59_BOTB1|nr:hypothetical protein BOTBODRAFT_100738 [Botryobasidium botryosum FD-172 SS1]
MSHPALPLPKGKNQAAELVDVALKTLGQAQDLVARTLTSDSQLTFQSELIPSSTIGKHLRHAREHYKLLMDCVSMSPRPKHLELCYDKRSRDVPMETSLEAARHAFEETKKWLEHDALRVDLEEPITLNAVTPYPQVLQTTYGRELWFVSLHAIHHWSMVRVIAAEMGLEVEETFGVAPSTMAYRELGTSSAQMMAKL